jgi:hypothetical protein
MKHITAIVAILLSGCVEETFVKEQNDTSGYTHVVEEPPTYNQCQYACARYGGCALHPHCSCIESPTFYNTDQCFVDDAEVSTLICCLPAYDRDCMRSDDCSQFGKCMFDSVSGTCMPEHREDCINSTTCLLYGEACDCCLNMTSNECCNTEDQRPRCS